MNRTNDLVATWGYRPDGAAQIFHLAPGAALPDGWHASPACITDPFLATAEALTEAAERSARAARDRPAPAPAAPDPQVAALAEENARLQAENAGLIADLAAARERLAQVDDEKAKARERLTSLSADIEQERAPTEDKPAPAAEPVAVPPGVQSGQAARSREKAREAVRTLLGEDLTDREIARRVGVSPSTVASVRKSLS